MDDLNLDALAWGSDGLLPAVVQDVDSGQVLMLAWVTRETLAETLAGGRTVFWSRSRQARWAKGDSSGHVQLVRRVLADCDGDAVLVLVDQVGAACHLGGFSCFARELGGVGPTAPAGAALGRLEARIRERAGSRPAGSYTAALLTAPAARRAQKVGEEAVEVVVAALAQDKDALVGELADLVYHLLVLMVGGGVGWADVAAELDRRRSPAGASGGGATGSAQEASGGAGRQEQT